MRERYISKQGKQKVYGTAREPSNCANNRDRKHVGCAEREHIFRQKNQHTKNRKTNWRLNSPRRTYQHKVFCRRCVSRVLSVWPAGNHRTDRCFVASAVLGCSSLVILGGLVVAIDGRWVISCVCFYVLALDRFRIFAYYTFRNKIGDDLVDAIRAL